MFCELLKQPKKATILQVTTRSQAKVGAEEKSDPQAMVSPATTPAAQQGVVKTAAHAEDGAANPAADPEAEAAALEKEPSPAGESRSGVSTDEACPSNTEAAMTVPEEEEPLATPQIQGSERGVVVDNEEGWEKFMREWKPIDEGDEKSSYVAEVMRDESLRIWRELADRKEKRYR